MQDLPADKREKIREHFDFFDEDQNDNIDFDEFANLLRIISPDSSTQQAAEGFSIIDTNSDGFIDFDEFMEWWETVWYEY